jgi:hypothetical protein
MSDFKEIKEQYIIGSNSFLSIDTKAYADLAYLGYRKDGNPDFLNILKNTFCSTNLDELFAAKSQVFHYVTNFLDFILKCNSWGKHTNKAICVVPRSKANLKKEQLLFKEAVKEAVVGINKRYGGLGFMDGTNFILRHTNTKTTHLVKSNISNDGDLPYPGITINTCMFSELIREKNIILIDDIYTRTVNVVEDCIQALYDYGARNVIFYSIAKTEHKNYL